MKKEYIMEMQNNKPTTVHYIISDACVCCGAYVPEGGWVCPQCQVSKYEKPKKESGTASDE